MIAFVTGASSGLGEAFASRLAGDGWDLVITARRGERLAALAGRLTAGHGVSVQTCAADLTDPRDVGELERVIVATEPDLLAVRPSARASRPARTSSRRGSATSGM